MVCIFYRNNAILSQNQDKMKPKLNIGFVEEVSKVLKSGNHNIDDERSFLSGLEAKCSEIRKQLVELHIIDDIEFETDKI